MRGKKKIYLLLVAIPVVLLVSVSLSFKLVVYVYPEGMSAYSSRYSCPRFLNSGYFVVSRSDESVSLIERIKTPSIYIYTPYAELPDGSRGAKYTLLHDGESTEIDIDYKELYSAFLSSLSEERIAFAFLSSDEENSSLYDELFAEYPTLSKLEYEGRVSVVNSFSLIKDADDMWAVIITDPLTSSALYRNTQSRVVMAESDAVAAVSLGSVISLSFDWGRIIRNVMRHGDISLYYTFSVLHQ